MSDDSADADALRQHRTFKASMDEGIAECGRLAKQTGNPVYVWVALVYLGWTRKNRAQHGLCEEDMPLPAWCADYLTNVADDIHSLAIGNDPRKAIPSHVWDEFKEGGWTRAFTPEMEAAAEQLRVPPDKAMTLVNRALGFTAPGFNAFKAYKAAAERMSSFEQFQRLQAEGLRSSNARETLGAEGPAREGSVLRRRITAGGRLASGRASNDNPKPDSPGKT